MGGGNSSRDEAKRRHPASQHGGKGDGSIGAPESDGNFCSVPQDIEFEKVPGASISVGLRVRLLAQHLPSVVAGDQMIGAVTEPHATAMRHCLEEGFSMYGSIKSFDVSSDHGVIQIRGSRGRPS